MTPRREPKDEREPIKDKNEPIRDEWDVILFIYKTKENRPHEVARHPEEHFGSNVNKS
mgnify:CR=1 FL=1